MSHEDLKQRSSRSASGPYAQLAHKYLEQGYAVIPLVQGQKFPLIKEWSKYSGRLPTVHEIDEWISRYPDASIGIVCGKASNVIGIDVDTDIPELLTIIESVIPPSPVRKRGKKGFTAYYRYGGHPSEKFALPGERKPLVELFSDGTQTVLPPSPHPDTGAEYKWLTPESLHDLAAAELPELPRDAMSRIGSALLGKDQPKIDNIDPGLPGRNNTLKEIAVEQIIQEMPTDEAIELLIHEDRRLFPDSPLFEDKTESNMKADARTNAAGFFHRIMQSINSKRASEGKQPYNPRPSVGPKDAEHKRIWPAPLAEAAYHGLAGEIVRLIEPHTEADPAALLLQLLTAFGNVVGRKPHFQVERDRHRANLFALIVGKTAKARKGTSLGYIKDLFQNVDAEWRSKNIQSGLSSGEGLIWAVRDPITKLRDGEEIVADPGIRDKRLLAVESEFASTLKVMARESNILSPILRDAWDGGNLITLSKNSPARATEPHISIIGHITDAELIKLLNETEMANGFGNRFLLVCAKRSRSLPFGGNVPTEKLDQLAFRLSTAVSRASQLERVVFSDESAKLWEDLYPGLSEGKVGIVGSLTARAEAQVLRLALLYALLDHQDVISEDHLQAALAVWRYSEESCRYIFGDATGDGVADEILKQLTLSPNGMTRTEIRDHFQRNQEKRHIDRALSLLRNLHKAHCRIERPGNGRPVERWFATQKTTT